VKKPRHVITHGGKKSQTKRPGTTGCKVGPVNLHSEWKKSEGEKKKTLKAFRHVGGEKRSIRVKKEEKEKGTIFWLGARAEHAETILSVEGEGGQRTYKKRGQTYAFMDGQDKEK